MDEFCKQKTLELKAKNLFRAPKGGQGADLINFTTNDYLGLRTHPEVIEAAISATWEYGTGAGASRLAGGNYDLIDEFEGKIAAYKGYEVACVFGSGFLANIGIIQALVDKKDAVIVDRLSHACIIDGAQLSGAKLLRFKHNNPQHLEQLLLDHRGKFRNVLVITEEIFSMDGDLAPIEELANVAQKYGAWLMVDGAHSLYKEEVRSKKAEVYVGTMSKALGSYGGYVCGSRVFIEYIKTSARSLIYSTALPAAAIAAAIAALDVIEKEKPYLKTLENAKLLGAESAIVPVIFGDEKKALAAEEELRQKKILVSAIRPPTVPVGTARLRISVSANHSKEEIEMLQEQLKKIV
jgi:8-amino-7-oxononanoate synthase